MSTEDTITREELAAAFRSGFLYTHSANAAHAAQEVFAHVARHREPEYEPGAIYQDPAGRAWFRVRRDDLSGASWRCCESGSIYSHNVLDRPLRKLVPEGSKPTHGQILAELTRATDLPRNEAIDLAWCLFRLAGGEQP